MTFGGVDFPPAAGIPCSPMYACSCRAVRERTVRAAIAGGAATLEEIGARCGAGTVCGGCHPILEDLLVTAVRVRTTTAA